LRIDPFYRVTAKAHPDLRAVIDLLAGRLLTDRVCLVHGDFSPKNVLTDGDEVWVLDWEVAHIGDRIFDLAFLISHLLCKALHRPGTARERWQQVHDLCSQGAGLLECSRRLGLHLNTVKRYGKADKPERLRRGAQYRPALVDPYRDYLRQRRAGEPGVGSLP
jgi:thiamine kinase-like enzyme